MRSRCPPMACLAVNFVSTSSDDLMKSKNQPGITLASAGMSSRRIALNVPRCSRPRISSRFGHFLRPCTWFALIDHFGEPNFILSVLDLDPLVHKLHLILMGRVLEAMCDSHLPHYLLHFSTGCEGHGCALRYIIAWLWDFRMHAGDEEALQRPNMRERDLQDRAYRS